MIVRTNRCALYNMTFLDEPIAGLLPDLPGFVAAVAEDERQAAMLVLQLHAIEQSAVWGADGAVTVAAWLREQCRMSNTEAHRLVRRGRFLSAYDSFADAALFGVLSAASTSPRTQISSASTRSFRGQRCVNGHECIRLKLRHSEILGLEGGGPPALTRDLPSSTTRHSITQ